MSLALMPYAGDITGIKNLIGSADPLRTKALTLTLRTDADDDEPEVISPEAAYNALIAGGPFPQEAAAEYGHAFHDLVAEFSTALPNTRFSPMVGVVEYLDAVDAALRTLGITALQVGDLAFSGLPHPLPWPELPGYGEWTHAQCVAGVEEARTADLHRVDPHLREAVEQAVGWARLAADYDYAGVMGFLI